jgi:hypothetical protein
MPLIVFRITPLLLHIDLEQKELSLTHEETFLCCHKKITIYQVRFN